MPANNMSSFRESLNAFRETVRNQVNNGIVVAKAWSLYFKDQLVNLFSQLQNFPQAALNAGRYMLAKLDQGFHFGVRFMRWLGRGIVELFRNIPEILRWFYNHFGDMLTFLKDLIVYVAKTLKNIVVGLGRAFKHIMMNIPHYLQQVYQFTIDMLILCKDVAVYLYQNARPLLTAMVRELNYLLTRAFEFTKWALKSLCKRMLLGIGMLYGISSILVEAIASPFNRLFQNITGVNLSNNAIFTTTQAVISAALAALLMIGAISYSFLTIALLLPLSMLHHEQVMQEEHALQEGVLPNQDPHAQVAQPEEGAHLDQNLEDRQAPLVHQFDQQRAQQDALQQPLSQEPSLDRSSDRLAPSFS